MSQFPLKKSLKQVVSWLEGSGIQSPEGGFYSWYDAGIGSYSYLYSEITGYGISTLLFLYGIKNDDTYLEKAKRAAQWIKTVAMHPCGGVRTRLHTNDARADKVYSFAEENIFSFDTGMVLYGVINLYRVTKESQYLAMATAMADFLMGIMQQEDGSLASVYNAKRGELFLPPEHKWSNQPAGFHAKVALGFVDLFDVTGDKKYYDAAFCLCTYALTTQEASGRFITDKNTGTTHLHSHCYSAEGLWYVGSRLGIPEFVAAAKKAIKWTLRYITASGINEFYSPQSGFTSFQRSDILAQAVRLCSIFGLDTGAPLLLPVLLSHQYDNGTSQSGGFLFSKNSGHLNSWCSMFALQALWAYENKGIPLDKKTHTIFV